MFRLLTLAFLLSLSAGSAASPLSIPLSVEALTTHPDLPGCDWIPETAEDNTDDPLIPPLRFNLHVSTGTRPGYCALADTDSLSGTLRPPVRAPPRQH